MRLIKRFCSPGSMVCGSDSYNGWRYCQGLGQLQQRHVPIALCTSSLKRSCDAVLSTTGLAAFFPDDRRTTLDNVTQGKPHPSPYIRAAELTLGLRPSECVALEDR